MRPCTVLSVRRAPGGTQEDDEAELLRRASAGDEGAFAALMAMHHRLIDAACATAVSDRTDREDAIQQALVDIWRGLPSFNGEAKLTTWMFRVAQNAARRQIRRNLRAVPTVPEDGDDIMERRGRADGWDDALDTRSVAIAAIEALPEDQRDALLLHTQLGMPLQEIADMKIVALGTVKAWLHRARSDIASALSAAGAMPT